VPKVELMPCGSVDDVGCDEHSRIYRVCKIYGERNTGTNALKNIVESNSDSVVLPSTIHEVEAHLNSSTLKFIKHLTSKLVRNKAQKYIVRHLTLLALMQIRPDFLGWKHGKPKPNRRYVHDAFLLLTVRDPVSWIASMYQRPHHRLIEPKGDFSHFIRRRWPLIAVDALGRGSVSNVAELWNLKVRALVEFSNWAKHEGATFKFIKFEDIIFRQENIFDRISRFLLNPADRFRIITKSTKEPDKDLKFYQEYYTQQGYLKLLTPADTEFVVSNIDWDIARLFGYCPPRQFNGPARIV
jgi:hypothetical protein